MKDNSLREKSVRLVAALEYGGHFIRRIANSISYV